MNLLKTQLGRYTLGVLTHPVAGFDCRESNPIALSVRLNMLPYELEGEGVAATFNLQVRTQLQLK